MDLAVIGVIGIAVLFILIIFMRMPIGFAMAFVGLVGFGYMTNWHAALNIVPLTLYRVVSDYTIALIPLFVLMGQFAGISGLSRDVYQAADKWLRRLPGSLGLATIFGCSAFAAVCGSSVATAATMGTIALPEMKKYKYDSALATGTVAAGGTLGFLIPPSIGFVMYGILTEESVGKLLIAGFFPGILLAILFLATVVIWVKLKPNIAPVNPESTSWTDKLLSLRGIWGIVMIFFLVMGGIYLGFFTPTEAGAVGAMGTFLFAIGKRRLNRSNLYASLLETSRIAVMIFIIIAGAFVFGFFLAVTQIPTLVANFVTGLAVSRYIILALFLILFLFLGCVLDVGAMLVLTIPVVFPAVMALGFDPIWFGVIVVLMMEAGLITPPVGLNVFIIARVAQDVPMGTIFRGTLPFLIAMIVVAIILTIFPEIALFLPQSMF